MINLVVDWWKFYDLEHLCKPPLINVYFYPSIFRGLNFNGITHINRRTFAGLLRLGTLEVSFLCIALTLIFSSLIVKSSLDLRTPYRRPGISDLFFPSFVSRMISTPSFISFAGRPHCFFAVLLILFLVCFVCFSLRMMIHNNLTSIPDGVFAETRLESLWVKSVYEKSCDSYIFRQWFLLCPWHVISNNKKYYKKGFD